MFKNDFNGSGLHFICDRCRTIVGTNTMDGKGWDKKWIKVKSPKWTRFGNGKGRNLDFCGEKCKIVFLKGRKYWKKKLEHIAHNEHRSFN